MYILVDKRNLLKRAIEIMNKNWVGTYTIPSKRLYPHQWSWDSCFHTIGLSYFNINRGISEMKNLFKSQWKNGMIPHIVFDNNSNSYFPSSDFYEIDRSDNSPIGIDTSGITQPPVHAIACYYLYQNNADKNNGKKFLRDIYKNLINFHRYLAYNRDPENSGLITIFHPWESGTDNSPIWDETLKRIVPQYLPKFQRLDIEAVDGKAYVRPDNETYNKFIYLIELMKKYNYNEKELYQDFPFKIKDILFSTLFYVSNKYIIKIAQILNQYEDIAEINTWLRKTENNFYKYFYPLGENYARNLSTFFYNYDIVKKDWIRKITVTSLIPIYSGLIRKREVEIMLRWMNHSNFCGQEGFCKVPVIPSTGIHENYFQENTYWRGPIWVNTNWMIRLGLLKYGYFEKAEQIKNGILELIDRCGIREYYNPFTGRGLGGKNFSWTAALVIDIIYS